MLKAVASLIDDVGVVIYDHKIIIQAIGWERVTVTNTLAY
jgi:hypothetical protein